MAKKKPNDYGTGIPLHEVEALARILLPQIQTFFESEEGQKEFEEWKNEKNPDSNPLWKDSISTLIPNVDFRPLALDTTEISLNNLRKFCATYAGHFPSIIDKETTCYHSDKLL